MEWLYIQKSNKYETCDCLGFTDVQMYDYSAVQRIEPLSDHSTSEGDILLLEDTGYDITLGSDI